MLIVERLILEHEDGTKDYDLYFIDSNKFTGRSLFVRRYGKVGSSGQAIIEDGEPHECNRKWRETQKKKTARGYSPTGAAVTREIHNNDDLKQALDRLPMSTITAIFARLAENGIDLSESSVEPPEEVEVKMPKIEDTPRPATWGTW